MRFSVLDRAARATGEGFPDVVGHARHVERLGFERFLVAEHHGVPGIPAGQPALLAAHVGLNDKTCCFPACRVKRQIVLVGVGV